MGGRTSWKALEKLRQNYAKVEKLREIMQIDENFLFDFNSEADIPLLTWLKDLATTFSSFWRKCFSVLLENETASLKSFWCHLSILTTHGLQLNQNQSDLLFFLHGVDLLWSENIFNFYAICALLTLDLDSGQSCQIIVLFIKQHYIGGKHAIHKYWDNIDVLSQ